MTVNAVRRPRRRAGRPVPEPPPAPVEKLAIGEINQTVFDCPKCARPLAMGARRCPGCRTRLMLGVPMAKASVFASGGLAVGLVFGSIGGLVFSMTRAGHTTPPGPTGALPSAAPVAGGGGTATPTPRPAPPAPSASTPVSTPSSDMPSLTRTALVQAIAVDDQLRHAGAALQAAVSAPSFDA